MSRFLGSWLGWLDAIPGTRGLAADEPHAFPAQQVSLAQEAKDLDLKELAMRAKPFVGFPLSRNRFTTRFAAPRNTPQAC